jgi:hypothetical protein
MASPSQHIMSRRGFCLCCMAASGKHLPGREHECCAKRAMNRGSFLPRAVSNA